MARANVIRQIGPGGHTVVAQRPALRSALAQDVIILHAPFTTERRFLQKLESIRKYFAQYRERFRPGEAWHWRHWLSLSEQQRVLEFRRQAINASVVPTRIAQGVLTTPAAHFRAGQQQARAASPSPELLKALARAVIYQHSTSDDIERDSRREMAEARVSGPSSVAPNLLPSLHRDAVVVLGMHRSGTSALSRALSFYGYAQPQDVMLPQVDNPKGSWEPRGVVELNTTILSALGGSWQQPGPFLVTGLGPAASRARVTSVVTNYWLDEAVSVLRHSYGDGPSIVIKDPRVVPLLALWEQAVAKAGYTPHYVLIYRHPLEVAASLRVRNEIKPRRALQLWTLYNLAALDAAAAPGFAGVLAYDELLADPAAALAPILGRMGLVPIAPCIEAAEGLRAYLSPAERHHNVSAEALNASPRVPAIVKDLWALLAGWNNPEAHERSLRIAALRATLDEMTLFSGPVVGTPATVLQRPIRAVEPAASAPVPAGSSSNSRGADETSGADRTLILHYHLFKNAGTSIDAMLKHNFGEKWAEHEFKTPAHQSNAAVVAAHLREHPDLSAFSSHTATLPTPQVDGLRIFPIIFLRHPVDRLRSAYVFERMQAAETFGARLAKATDFAGYVQELIDHPGNRAGRNFQAFRLALNEPPEAGPEYERSLRALASLPFVGLVEAYERSVERLRLALLPFYPDFAPVIVRRNVTRSAADPLDARLAEIEQELGRELYGKLCEANADDIRLFEEVRARYAHT